MSAGLAWNEQLSSAQPRPKREALYCILLVLGLNRAILMGVPNPGAPSHSLEPGEAVPMQTHCSSWHRACRSPGLTGHLLSASLHLAAGGKSFLSRAQVAHGARSHVPCLREGQPKHFKPALVGSCQHSLELPYPYTGDSVTGTLFCPL